MRHNKKTWDVAFHEEFEKEFMELAATVQTELLAYGELLGMFGPQLARPYADTLDRSKHKNMKELRFDADNGVWRVAFAFDPKRKAVLLVAGNKAGVKQKRFYQQLIKKADKRLDDWLEQQKGT
jgi:hypothetical protein